MADKASGIITYGNMIRAAINYKCYSILNLTGGLLNIFSSATRERDIAGLRERLLGKWMRLKTH